jgi:hypothetical protein
MICTVAGKARNSPARIMYTLPSATLLGRGAVIAQRARNVIVFHELFQRDRRERRPRAKQVMAAGVARPVGR